MPSHSPIAVRLSPEAQSWLTRVFLEPWKHMLQRKGVPTLRYLTETEAHTFAFSVAANAILSFFPFLVLIMWLVRNAFHSQSMLDALQQLLRDHLPAGQDVVMKGLKDAVNARKEIRWASLLVLFISSTGVFVPLELALNQIWRFTKNRSYLGNQFISLLLAFSCGILGLASVGMAAGNKIILNFMLFGHTDNLVFRLLTALALKIFAILASITIFFLIYWLLPNGPVAARSVLPAAAFMGVLWELSKYVYIKALPWLDFREAYGPFSISVTLMFWAFLSGLMLLAGAHLASEFVPQSPPVSQPVQRPAVSIQSEQLPKEPTEQLPKLP